MGVISTSNLEFSRAFRCSRSLRLRSATQSLASSNLLGAKNPILKLSSKPGCFQIGSLARCNFMGVISTSNLEFSRAFRCSRSLRLRSATQSLASSNLLGAKNPILKLSSKPGCFKIGPLARCNFMELITLIKRGKRTLAPKEAVSVFARTL